MLQWCEVTSDGFTKFSKCCVEITTKVIRGMNVQCKLF